MIATYCLLTLRPDIDRVDVLCIGAVVRDGHEGWHVAVPPAAAKKLGLLTELLTDRLELLASNLLAVLGNCITWEHARELIARIDGSVALHDFEGSFYYENAGQFNQQLRAIVNESVLPSLSPTNAPPARTRVVKPRTRARLKQHFESMGILGRNLDAIDDHKVVRNFPVSLQHGLTAEFALQNSVMHITETVDFDVVEDSVRAKTFEAQAKCLVLRAARERFGGGTQCYIVMSGSSATHAARTVDLLSTVGQLYSVESGDDMAAYLDRIGAAARSTLQL